MIKFGDFLKYHDAYVIRHSPNDAVIPNGGWHFSYMGGIKQIQKKMATGSHQEYNNSKYNTKEKIISAILKKHDVFGHGDRFDFIPDGKLPKYIRENREKYSKMFVDTYKIQSLNDRYFFFLEIKHYLRIGYRAIRKKLYG